MCKFCEGELNRLEVSEVSTVSDDERCGVRLDLYLAQDMEVPAEEREPIINASVSIPGTMSYLVPPIYFPVNFCPVCGRNLKKTANQRVLIENHKVSRENS